MNHQERTDVLDEWDELHRVGWRRERNKSLNNSLNGIYCSLRSALFFSHRRKPALRLAFASMLLLTVFAFFVVNLFESGLTAANTSRFKRAASEKRGLTIAITDGGCKVKFPHLAKKTISPTYQASFPGSGARMTWNLVEALTGIYINDDYNSAKRGYERVVIVKTHYPHKAGRKIQNDSNFGGAILLLRNPLLAIPSYYNFKYERLNNLPNHSTRAPNEDWVKFRDSAELGFQISAYEQFVSFWMGKYKSRNRLLLVTYENLIHDEKGPLTATRIADFLNKVEGVQSIAHESISCVWRTVVSDKQKAVEKQGQNHRPLYPAYLSPSRGGPDERHYTEAQLRDMKAMLERLLDRFRNDAEFTSIMRSYVDTVTNSTFSDLTS